MFLIRQDRHRYRRCNGHIRRYEGTFRKGHIYYYEEKIAGVLTTVLAASLLVGGNHPVTVQVDNMISGTQDDEDTQSDEAEAEAAEAEEEQSEEAKVAADPEDQPAATETPKEEKKAEKETQKREAAENSSDSTSSDEKTLLKKAKKLAQQYDYTGAISVLKNNWKLPPVTRCRKQQQPT